MPFWMISGQRLEMATHFSLARFHASLVPEVVSEVLDMTMGAGFDTVAFLMAGLQVSGWESDESAFYQMMANRALWKLDSLNVFHGDSTNLIPDPTVFVYADPMRRSGTKRMAGYRPDPSGLKVAEKQPVLIKLSPMEDPTIWINRGFKTIAVSYERECREVLIHRNLNPEITARSVWIDGVWFQSDHQPDQIPSHSEGPDSIYWPDPALLVSGLAGVTAEALNLKPIQPGTWLCLGKTTGVEPLFIQYYLLDNQYYKLSFLDRMLGGLVRERPLIFKKKYSRVDIDSFQGRYQNRSVDYSQKPIIVLITDIGNKSVFYLCEPADLSQNSFIKPR